MKVRFWRGSTASRWTIEGHLLPITKQYSHSGAHVRCTHFHHWVTERMMNGQAVIFAAKIDKARSRVNNSRCFWKGLGGELFLTAEW